MKTILRVVYVRTVQRFLRAFQSFMYKACPLAFVTLALMPFCLMEALAQEPELIVVSPEGDDIEGDGSPENPYQSIGRAIEEVEALGPTPEAPVEIRHQEKPDLPG